MAGSVTERIGENLHKELVDIQRERVKRGKEEKKKSIKVLTNLLVKHNAWGDIKEDMITIDIKENEK